MSSEKNKNWEKGNRENIQIFDQLLNKHGKNFKALDWGSRESQLLRFKILCEFHVQNNSSLLDVGCGLGDLYEWLTNNNIKVDYTGLDITPSLVKASQERFPNAQFLQANIIEDSFKLNGKYDYVIASGIFSKHQKAGSTFTQTMIKKMFEICNYAVAFNSLNSLSPYLDEKDFGLHPNELLDFCRKLTPWIHFRQDYHPNDMTFYLFKEQRK